MSALGGVSVVESPYARAGAPILADAGGVGARTLFAHPLDVLLITRPDLSPVGRVMVLVDRVVDQALRRIES